VRILFFLSTFLLASCNFGHKARIEYGYGEPVLVADALNRWGSGEPADIHHASIKVGPVLYESERLEFDCLGGGWAVLPQDQQSSIGYGVVVSPRLFLKSLGGTAVPYGQFDLGLGYWETDVQGSDFGFLVGGAVGLAFLLSKSISTTVAYSLYHFSNAGLAKPNPGLNSDLISLGLEYDF